jgi:cytochrome P450
VREGGDMLTAFLEEDPSVFTDEFVVDEILDFFTAAVYTTMNAVTTCMVHLLRDKDSLAKVRAEWDKVKTAQIKANPSLSTQSDSDHLMSLLTIDNIVEFEYMSWVASEALRHMPPV